MTPSADSSAEPALGRISVPERALCIPVSRAWIEFTVDVAVLADGCADIIRGLIVSEPARAILGLVLVALVLARFAPGPSLGRNLLAWLGTHRWTRRGFIALSAIAAAAESVQFLSSASRHDWGSSLFHVVRSAASLAVAVCVAVQRRTIDAAA